MGKRYAYEVLRVMGRETQMNADYKPSSNLRKFYTVKEFDTHYDAKARASVTLQLWATFLDGHREDLTEEATFTSEDFKITNGKIRMPSDGKGGVVTATYTDFLGTEHNVDITIGEVETACHDIAADEATYDIFDLQGRKVSTKGDNRHLTPGIYVINNRKVFLR